MGDKVTELNDDLTDPALFARASLKDCITYAVSQLDDAAQKLPLDNGSDWALGRATKGAAMALKSRLLLYAASPLYNAGTWSDAAAAAKAVMDLGKYSLFQGGYRELFLNQDNSEVIFERLTPLMRAMFVLKLQTALMVIMAGVVMFLYKTW